MTEFNIRSESVDVDEIMRQVRARIREKRGVDYTEAEIRQLANVKLERFLEPGSVRSDLTEQFRRRQPAATPATLAPPPALAVPAVPSPPAPPPAPPPPLNYSFDEAALFGSSRAPVRWIRRLVRPVLKLFLNPGSIVHVLHLQTEINTRFINQLHESRDLQAQSRRESYEQTRVLFELYEQLRVVSEQFHAQLREQTVKLHDQIQKRRDLERLYFEILHNLVVEMTKLGIEAKNLKTLVDSLASRLEFDERRGRALEGVVEYRPGMVATPPAGGPPSAAEEPGGEARRRRRRRRRRRPWASVAPGAVAPSQAGPAPGSGSVSKDRTPPDAAAPRHEDPGPEGSDDAS